MQAPKPTGKDRLTESADKRWADGVVTPHEGAAGSGALERFVAETAQRPHLRAVVGAVNAGGKCAKIKNLIFLQRKYIIKHGYINCFTHAAQKNDRRAKQNRSGNRRNHDGNQPDKNLRLLHVDLCLLLQLFRRRKKGVFF